MKEACWVSEQVTLDAMTGAFGDVPPEYVAPELRKVMGPAANAIAPALQQLIDARYRVIDARVEGEKFDSQPEETKKFLAFQEFYGLGKMMHVTVKAGPDGYIRSDSVGKGITIIATPAETRATYQQKIIAEKTRVYNDEFCSFRKRMRSDPAYRDRMLSSGLVWFDCKTSIIEANASTVLLEGLFCVCSLSLLPAHHTKQIDVEVTCYAKDGKIYKHKYTDCFYNVTWFFLFPIGLFQDGIPDPDTVTSVVNNLGRNVVTGYRNDQNRAAANREPQSANPSRSSGR